MAALMFSFRLSSSAFYEDTCNGRTYVNLQYINIFILDCICTSNTFLSGIVDVFIIYPFEAIYIFKNIKKSLVKYGSRVSLDFDCNCRYL